MPVRTPNSLIHLEPASLTTIDTDNPLAFHSLWSMFASCSNSMENGKRLENMSWRLFSRETLICNNNSLARSSLPTRPSHRRHVPSEDRLPALSSSVESTSSAGGPTEHVVRAKSDRPEIRRVDSAHQQKHISASALEKIVASISEENPLEPLSPLPPSLAIPRNATSIPTLEVEPSTPATPAPPAEAEVDDSSRTAALDPISSLPQLPNINPDSSTSTVATDARSELSDMSPPLGANSESTSTELSSSSIVRGFSKDCISSYNHSRTQLAPTPQQSILKPSPLCSRSDRHSKRKNATFIFGGSSGENDESSLESHFEPRSSITEGLQRSAPKKTSFKDEVSMREIIQDRAFESEEVFESSDEEDDDDDDQSESAIEDEDDDGGEWEDEEESSSLPRVDEKEMFQRVDSRPNLTSRRSLLTTMMHEGDRATALQNAASRSTPAIRRSRNASPNGPMGTSPPQQQAPEQVPLAFRPQAAQPRPIAMPMNATQSQAHSPRTTRRHMLQTELTESLRRHLLWERQTKAQQTKSHLKRRHTSNDVKNLKQYPNPAAQQPTVHLDPKNERLGNPNSWNNYFDTGLQEYHQKGW